MKRSAILLLLVGASTAGWGYPHHAFLDLPIAVPLGDPGCTYFQVRLADREPGFTIARSIGKGIDILAATSLKNPFSLGLHALLLQDFGPLSIALDAGGAGIKLSAGLFLGPVRLDWGKAIGQQGRPWWVVSVSPDQRVTLVLGVERIKGRFFFLGGARLFPLTGTFGLSLLLREGRLTLTAGGFS